ncbi:MAG: Coenzyme F420 hydrogenase/dehydrogenase, beta subunit C-terminal domain [Candidatus Lokiarchaeota archaeon]|nr:Coenzyme F420 hydrogenase/dehydrogenase, beta subunit C-terminal domain [Candidatus Lokiarchaeota archaeon]
MEEKKQVVNYLQSNFLGIGFQELRDHVINNQNCILCGTCTSICPRIGMNETEPTLLEYDPECSTCFRYCPQTYFPEEMFEKELFPENITKSYPLGNYQKIIAAKSNNEDILRVAQNGGVVSSLLIHALDTGIIDGVLLTDRDEMWRPKPVVARTANEILSCAGSKYTIASTLSIYNTTINEFKLEKLAFVGMPCQIQAVRKLQLCSPLSNDYGKFALIIGLYCFSNYSYNLMHTFIQGELGISLSNIEKMDVSHGKFYIYLKDETIKEVPIKEIKKYTWISCHYCKDYTAEIADISVGSVGASKNDLNSVIVRTDIGAKIFNEAVKTKKILTSDGIDVPKIEKESLRKKTQITLIDGKILEALRFLNIPDVEIKTYTTLMSLGSANESILSKVMKMEKDLTKMTLNKLKERKWITATNGLYSSSNPKLVINNEINRVRNEFLEKIKKLKTEVLPNLETVYAQNNHLRQNENYE